MMNRHTFVAMALLPLWCATTATAQGWAENITVGGQASGEHISYFQKKPGKINSRNQGELLLNVSTPAGKEFGFYTSTRLRDDLSDNTRTGVTLKEAYAKLRKSWLDLKVGKQVMEWGQSDKIRPTNNLCPMDYTDYLDSERLGVVAVNATVDLDSLGRLQAIFIPVFTPTLLPGSQSRWHLDQGQMAAMQMASRYPGMKAGVSLLPDQTPKADIGAAQWGVQYSLSLWGFDFDVNYLYGYSFLPEVLLSAAPVARDSLSATIAKHYYRQQVAGGSLSRVMGQYACRVECAEFWPDGLNASHSYFRYSVGLDRTFYDIVGRSNLMLLAQWMDEVDDNDVDYSNYDINHLFRQSLMARASLDCGMYLNVAVQGIYSFYCDNYYVQPAVEYHIGDGLNAYCRVDLMGGKDGGFYAYYGIKRLQAGLRYDF